MPVSGAAPRILVVEDEPVINQALTDRLRGSGYDVVQAWDGPGAVAQFAATAPDLVLLDVMPRSSTATRCAGGSRPSGRSRCSC